MTWQEELRRLDAELAAGRISAEEYRTRRDEARGRHSPTAGPRGQQPFPPAFSWADSRPQLHPVSSEPQQPAAHAATGEAAQVVPGQVAREDADRARIVSFAGPPDSGPGPERVRSRPRPRPTSAGARPSPGHAPHRPASGRSQRERQEAGPASRPAKGRRRLTAVLWSLVVLGIVVAGLLIAVVPARGAHSQSLPAKHSSSPGPAPGEPPGPRPALAAADVSAPVPPGRAAR